MPMYNLIKYSDNYSKIFGILRQHYRDEPTDTLASSELNKKIRISQFSGITITNNKIKDIMKVIRSSENKGILIKGTPKKLVVRQEGQFLNFIINNNWFTTNKKCPYTIS